MPSYLWTQIGAQQMAKSILNDILFSVQRVEDNEDFRSCSKGQLISKIHQKRVHFLEDLKTPKFHSENQDVIQLPFLETLTHTYLIHCSRLTRIVSTSLKKW